MAETFEVESVLKVKDEASSAVELLGQVADKTAAKMQAVGKSAEKAGHAVARGEPKFTSLGNTFGGVQEQVQSLKGALFELAAGVGIATSLKGAFDKFIDTNSESEQATRAFGATLSGLYDTVDKGGKKRDPVANLHYSLERANEVMEKLNKTAFDTGIPMSSLASTIKTLAPGIAAAGGSTEVLEKLTTDLAKSSRGMGLGIEESASQFQMAVKFGRMGRGAGILTNIGADRKKLSGMKTEVERLKYLTDKLQLIKPDAIAQIVTYKDLVATIRERFDQMAEAAGKPLFEKAKETVKKLGDWIAKNRDKIQETANLVATKFVEALEASIKVVTFLYEQWDKVKVVVIAIAGIMAAKKAASWAREFGSSIAEVTKRIAEMHAVKLGQQFGDAAAPGLEKAGAGFGGGIGKAAAAGMILEAAMIGYAIGTAINGWLMKQEWWNKLWTPAESLKDKAADVAYKRVEAERAQNAKALIAWATESAETANRMGLVGPGGKKGAWRPEDILNREKEIFRKKEEAGLDWSLPTQQRQAHLGDYSAALMALKMAQLGPEAPAKKAVGPEGPGYVPKTNFDFRNSHFDITQNFAEGFDPDRIAVAFTNDLSSLGEMRSSSTYAPIAGVR